MNAVVLEGRPLLVAMCNPHRCEPEYALGLVPPNAAGSRLFAMLADARPGTTKTEYLEGFERINLCASPRWERSEARARAREMMATLEGRIVLLLGREVQFAFGIRAEAGEPLGARSLKVPGRMLPLDIHWAPHPSGRCLLYNELKHRITMGRMLARMLDGERGLLLP